MTIPWLPPARLAPTSSLAAGRPGRRLPLRSGPRGRAALRARAPRQLPRGHAPPCSGEAGLVRARPGLRRPGRLRASHPFRGHRSRRLPRPPCCGRCRLWASQSRSRTRPHSHRGPRRGRPLHGGTTPPQVPPPAPQNEASCRVSQRLAVSPGCPRRAGPSHWD